MKTFTVLALLATTSQLFAGVVVATPEPSTALLLGGGLGAIILAARWNRSRKKK
jgi:hypothetical protein